MVGEHDSSGLLVQVPATEAWRASRFRALAAARMGVTSLDVPTPMRRRTGSIDVGDGGVMPSLLSAFTAPFPRAMMQRVRCASADACPGTPAVRSSRPAGGPLFDAPVAVPSSVAAASIPPATPSKATPPPSSGLDDLEAFFSSTPASACLSVAVRPGSVSHA